MTYNSSKKMICRICLFSLIGFVFSIQLAAQNVVAEKPDVPFQVTEFKLSNGLTVVLSEDNNMPVVFGAVVVKAGAKNDPHDATGMAHYQEHMLFKGTDKLGTVNWEAESPYIDSIFMMYDKLGLTKDEKERLSIQTEINRLSIEANKYAIPNELSNLIKEIGGTNLNAGTGPDETVYYNTFPPHRIEQWLEIYSHRFINPVFRSFQAELEVVYEEKNLYNDIFIMPLFEKFSSSFFKKHPYGQQTIIGTVEDLKNPSLSKMLEFFNTWYVPNNMALILCGDFNTEEVVPLIKEKFGKWESKELPPKVTWDEEPFKGREQLTVKMSPVKLGLLGFRIPPAGHQDEVAIDVMMEILSNENQSGLIDKLVIDNKLLAAQLFPMVFNDYGAGMILMVPKIIGQSLDKTEKMLINELSKVRKGEFDDWLLEAAKNKLYVDHYSSIENVEGKAMMLISAFSTGTSIDEALSYPDKVMLISKNDVTGVANRYFGDNFLAFYSKMGFPKKEKIAKPGYKPVLSNTEAKSEFAVKLADIPLKSPKEVYFDFQKDIINLSIGNGHNLIWTHNPYNDIFSLNLRYKIGNYRLPMLRYVSSLMNYAGTSSLDVKSVKDEFSKLGCTYRFSSNDNYLDIELKGMEINLDPALALLSNIILKPVIEKNKIDIIVEEEKTARKLERSEPDNIADALLEYVKYGEKSSYINRLTIKEIKRIKPDSAIALFAGAIKWEADVFFTGRISPVDIKTKLEHSAVLYNDPQKSLSPEDIPVINRNENIVFLVDKKNSLQSKINFMIEGEPYDIKDDAAIKAFNLYFGGDFSGLVLQEIREYRSLAYSAGAYYSTPARVGKPGLFSGYVGTQADKTIIAIEVFDSLVRHMPVKVERLNMLREYLIGAGLSSRPSFRNLGFAYSSWKLKGYEQDPLKILLNNYRKMDFGLITEFYNSTIKNKNMIIMITGDKKRIEFNQLERFGRVVEIKEKNLFKN